MSQLRYQPTAWWDFYGRLHTEGDDDGRTGGTAALLRDGRDADRRRDLGGVGDAEAAPAARRG
ncbi:hypothetical protein GO011_08005 [Mycobacterium sp. 20091114027_K0903767]|nr:hypothetical protein [Mycobacterium sp. 20091114027_K0903767]